jgi:hypothetical protein
VFARGSVERAEVFGPVDGVRSAVIGPFGSDDGYDRRTRSEALGERVVIAVPYLEDRRRLLAERNDRLQFDTSAVDRFDDSADGELGGG